MNKINTDFIKDLIIGILIAICIVLIVLVIMYNRASFTKVIPESQDYAMPEDMLEELNKGYAEDKETQLITTYYIDATDLKKYEKTKQYNKGKKNPFAIESDETDAELTGSSNTTQDGDSSSTSTHFYTDDGTK